MPLFCSDALSNMCSFHTASRRRSVWMGVWLGVWAASNQVMNLLVTALLLCLCHFPYSFPFDALGLYLILILSVQALPYALFWVTQDSTPGLGTNTKSRPFTLYPVIHMGPWSSWKKFFYWIMVLNFILFLLWKNSNIYKSGDNSSVNLVCSPTSFSHDHPMASYFTEAPLPPSAWNTLKQF